MIGRIPLILVACIRDGLPLLPTYTLFFKGGIAELDGTGNIDVDCP